MTDEVICKHPDQPHTIWYWIEDLDPVPVPHQARFDNRSDALRQAEAWIKEAGSSLRWMKIFRSDNEMYTCWNWRNPEEAKDEPEKIETHAFVPIRPKWFMPRCKVCREFKDHPIHKV